MRIIHISIARIYGDRTIIYFQQATNEYMCNTNMCGIVFRVFQ